jgi:hypothetical protein
VVELVERVLGLKDEELFAEDGKELRGILQVVVAVAERVSCGGYCAVEPVGAGGVVARGQDGDLCGVG